MLYSVHYLRGLASILVLVHHACWKAEQYSQNPFSAFTIGDIGVDLFFIISGFIMCDSLNKKRGRRFLKYLQSRAYRVIPLYWSLTILASAVYFVFPSIVNSSGGETSVLFSFIMWPSEKKFLINNGWTLVYEMFFYLVFGLSFLSSSSKRFLWPMLALIVIVLVGAFLDVNSYSFSFFTNSILLEFVYGICIFYIRKSDELVRILRWPSLLLGFMVAIYINFYGEFLPRFIEMGIPSFLIVLGFLGFEKDLDKESYLKSRLLLAAGSSSYSLYLFHSFSLSAVSILLARTSLNSNGLVFILLLVISSLVSGYLVYLLLERPLIMYFKGDRALRKIELS